MKRKTILFIALFILGLGIIILSQIFCGQVVDKHWKNASLLLMLPYVVIYNLYIRIAVHVIGKS